MLMDISLPILLEISVTLLTLQVAPLMRLY